LLYAFVLYVKVRRWKTSVQLVHSHHVFPQGLFGFMLARMLNVPLIVTATGGDVNVEMKRWTAIRAVSVFILKRASRVIAVSRPLQRALRQFGIWNSVYIPNSVDQQSVQTVKKSAKEDSILYVASITQRKRPLVLLQAFDSVAKVVPTATLTMIGKGPQMGAVKHEIRKRGLTDRVSCLSDVDGRTLNRIRANSKIFVLPSASEGLSLSLLEAMAAGQVVIASKNESHQAVLRNRANALLFATDNSEELARQIILAITNQGLSYRLSMSANALFEREFSNTIVAPRLEELYLEALDRGIFDRAER
jgi:glycosyltransferase involved in cell wall biosynthesis